MRLYDHIGHTYFQVVDGVTELFGDSVYVCRFYIYIYGDDDDDDGDGECPNLVS